MERNKWRQRYYEECHQIDEECKLRMKAGEGVYHEADITEKITHLMGRDLIEATIEELFDQINYAKAEIIKLRVIKAALEADSEVQSVAPSGKPKVAPSDSQCHLTA